MLAERAEGSGLKPQYKRKRRRKKGKRRRMRGERRGKQREGQNKRYI